MSESLEQTCARNPKWAASEIERLKGEQEDVLADYARAKQEQSTWEKKVGEFYAELERERQIVRALREGADQLRAERDSRLQLSQRDGEFLTELLEEEVDASALGIPGEDPARAERLLNLLRLVRVTWPPNLDKPAVSPETRMPKEAK